MKEWERIDYFADGVIYAYGNKRKIIIPGSPVIYYEVDAQEVRWHRNISDGKPIRLKKDK